MLLLPIGLYLNSAPSANTGVVTPRIETLFAVCQRLSAQTNSKIEVDRELAGLPLYVEPRRLTTVQLVSAIAYSFRASAVPTKWGWKITRTGEDRRQMLTDIRRFWRERLNSWFAESDSQSKQASVYGSRYDQYRHYSDQSKREIKALQDPKNTTPIQVSVSPMDLTPTGSLYLRLIRTIGIDSLVNTTPGLRRIWSNLPENGELPCPEGNALLRDYAKDQHDFVARDSSANIFGDPTRFTLRQVGGTTFTLNLYDASGHSVGRYGGPPFDFLMAGPILLSARLIVRSFSGETKEWRPVDMRCLSMGRALGYGEPAPASLASKFSSIINAPERDDPLNLEAGPGLTEMARRTPGAGYIAVPMDQLLDDADGCVLDDRLNVTAFNHVLHSKWEYEQNNIDGVTVLRPRDPYRWQKATVDREALALEVRRLREKDRVGISDYASACLRLFPQGDSRVARCVLDAAYRSQPHAWSPQIRMSADELALISAALDSDSEHHATPMDWSAEPLKSIVNQGIDHGWLRFESAIPLPNSELDPAVIVDYRNTSPKVEVRRTSSPVMGLFMGSTPDPAPEEHELFGFKSIGDTIAGSMIQRIGIDYKKYPDLLPNREQMLRKLDEGYFFQLGLEENATITLYATPNLRFQATLREQLLDKANLRFGELPQEIRDTLLKESLDWIDLFVQGKVGQGEVPPLIPREPSKPKPPF